MPLICSKQAWHMTPSEKKSSVLCAYSVFELIVWPVSTLRSQNTGTREPAGRPWPCLAPVAIAIAIACAALADVDLLLTTSGRTKLAAMIATTAAPIVPPFQLRQNEPVEVALRDVDFTGGTDARCA